MEWKPIETAPKDGTPLLGFIPCYFQGKGGQSVIMWMEGEWYDNRAFVTTPSHWADLPAPPSDTEPSAYYYRAMKAGDFMQAVGDDAMKWAEAFCEMNPSADKEKMFGWFANAIEGSWDIRTGRVHNGDHAEFLLTRENETGPEIVNPAGKVSTRD